MVIAPNFLRPGVVAGFALTLPGSGLTPGLQRGVLFAQGTMYQPGSDPASPAAPASGFHYLGYNTSTGLYWTVNPAGDTAGDAVLGWAQAGVSDLIAVSAQTVAVVAVASTALATTTGTIGAGSGTTGSLDDGAVTRRGVPVAY
jgi:hypothetical protein